MKTPKHQTRTAGKRILFIPAQMGLAHLLRCQAVAIELHKRGYEIHMLIEKTKQDTLPKVEGIIEHIIDVERLLQPEVMEDFTRKRFTSEQVKHYVNLYRRVIDEIDPDFTVVDTELFGLIAAYLNKRKLAFIVNALALPLRSGLYGEKPHKNLFVRLMRNGSSLITNRFIESMFRDLLKKYGVSQQVSIHKLLSNMSIILPEWGQYVQLRKYYGSFNFVGPILNPLVEKKVLAFEKQIRAQAGIKPIVYVSFGGTGFSKSKLEQIVVSLVKENYFVIVSTGTITDPRSIHLEKKQGYAATYVPGLSATSLADCVVTHCSQGTVVQSILQGTPIIGVPFNLDQLVHAHKVEEFGIGINAHKLKTTDFLANIYDSGWLSDSAKSIPVTNIVLYVKQVAKNPIYKERLQAAQERFGNMSNGAELAANVIASQLNE